MDAYWNRISMVLNAFVKQGKLIRYPVLFEPDFEYKDTYQSVSIFFKELDKIDEFSKFLKDQNESDSEDLDKFQLDMTKVKEKKNYLFLSNVSIITSIFLVFFSTAAISLFIYFLLSAHLNKVKMNIGTFLAIGLSTNQSRKIYFSIILQFMISALILSACIALSLGELINYIIKLNVKSDDDMKYFEFFDWITLLTFFIVLLTSLFVSRFTIRKILFKSPGDLVYNR
jgi:ABC-type antimicrobial peptide transport system permease subunit